MESVIVILLLSGGYDVQIKRLKWEKPPGRDYKKTVNTFMFSCLITPELAQCCLKEYPYLSKVIIITYS